MTPTDKDLIDFAVAEQFILFCDTDEFAQIARAVLAKWGTPTPAGDPLDVIELMRVVMKADEETRDFALRGTTNWAAHIGKAVQNAVIGITQGEQHDGL